MAIWIDLWRRRTVDLLQKEQISEINSLIPQLTSHAFEPVTKERLKEVFRGNWSAMATMYENGRLCAVAELNVFTTITQRKGQIDNVVVDEKYRGRKFGEKLMSALLDRAFVRNSKSLDLVQLTSDPENSERVPARSLYKKLGFKERYPGFFVITRDEWMETRIKLGNV